MSTPMGKWAARGCVLGALMVLTACSSGDPGQSAPLPVNSKAAADQLALFEEARAAGRGQLARAYAEDIRKKYPGSPAAAQVQLVMAEVTAIADAEREVTRLANLWIYHQVNEQKGPVFTAFMYESDSAAMDRDLRPKLVLRQHPEWGRNVYLLFPGGHFTCGARCKVQIAFDDAAAKPFEASQPEGAPEPAMFVEEAKRFLEALPNAHWVTLTMPVRGGSKSFRFEVAGLDIARLGPLPVK